MRIKSARLIGEFRIELVFEDGVKGVHDFSNLAGKGVFSLWNDPAKFADFHIGSCGELVWSDEVDACPDSLYLSVTGKNPEDVFPALGKELCHA